MYKEVFNFTSRPFTAAPYVKHYFASESMHQTLTKAQDCIERSAGPVVAIGGPGSGKSLLLGMLEERYRGKFSVANLSCIRLKDRADLLKSILFTLDQPHQGMSEGDLRFALINYLKPNPQCPNGVLLLVDDAQTLTFGLLDEIRLITNFVRDGQARVRLVLAGTQSLEDNLTSNKLQSLNQRIAARCYLTSMSRDETANYIAEHIDRVGGNGRQLLDSQSLRAVHDVSDGCPRLVNQVCEHALIVASTRGASVVTENHVREAWDDVQGIPGDWSAPADTQKDTSALQNDDGWTVIEFGQLDEDENSETSGNVYEFGTEEAQNQDDVSSETPAAEAATTEPIAEPPAKREAPAVAEFQTHPTPAPPSAPPSQPQPEPVTQFIPAAAPKAPTFTSTQTPIAPEPKPAPEPSAEPTVEQIAAANGVKLREPQETVDPFEESFAEEEQLQDRFNPVVAHQNQASLDVTSADLEAIKPEDEGATPQPPQVQVVQDKASGEQPGESDSPSYLPAFTAPAVQVVGATQADPQQSAPAAPQQATEQSPQQNKPQRTQTIRGLKANFPVAQPPSQPEAASQSGATAAVAVESEPPAAPEAKSNRDEVVENADEIERQAEAILERLRLSTAPDATGGTTEASSEAAPEINTEERVARELDESQKVLQEILSQKSILEAAREQTDQPAAAEPEAPGASVNLEYPVSQTGPTAPPRRDDSEMLIVSRMEQQLESPKPSKPKPIPFPETPVSKGNAQRMDYQQLFDQLRDVSKD